MASRWPTSCCRGDAVIGRLLGILVPVVALIGGAVGGETLRGTPAQPAVEAGVATAAAGEGEGGIAEGRAEPTAPDPRRDPAASEESGGHGPAAGTDAGEAEPGGSFRFPQQFFVPLVRNGDVAGMMVLSLSVEMPAGESEAVYTRENQLRDALLRRLLIHANSGGFDGNFTAEAHIALLREELLQGAKAVSPEVSRVLIGDIARQDG